MAVALVGLYLLLVCARAMLAFRYAAGFSPQREVLPVTIVQPILSGDPRLETMLRQNLSWHPEAEFLWMIDHDDVEAHRIARQIGERVRIVECPSPANGENPKLAKLIRALPLVRTARLIVLDDDTVMPEGSSLPAGPLVTGLPVFAATGSIFERLIGGFVNGNALLTYLPAAHLGLQRSINGMFYAVDVEPLRAMGGFEAAGHALTDDYSVARLYARNGLGITQAITPASVAMTVTGAGHYVRVMRRWMIFASLYFRENLSLGSVFWIGLPGLLPLLGLIVALAQGFAALWMGLLAGKAVLNRCLLWKITRTRSSVIDLVFEIAADLLVPVWMVLAFIAPGRLSWRSRKIVMDGAEIRYR